MYIILCVLHREYLVAITIGNRDLITILQTVVSSVNKMRTRALQDWLFQETFHDDNFHRLVYSSDVRGLSIGSCLTRFVLLFHKDLVSMQTRDIILRNSLIDKKMLILYMEDIFCK